MSNHLLRRDCDRMYIQNLYLPSMALPSAAGVGRDPEFEKTDTLLFQFVTSEESVYEKSPENRKKPAALVLVNRAAGFYEKGNNKGQTLFL